MKPEQARSFAPSSFNDFITTTIWSAAIVLCIQHIRCLINSRNDNDFSCSVQTPLISSCLLYPGMLYDHYIRFRVILFNRHTRIYLLSTSFCAYLTRLQSQVYVLQLLIKHLRNSCSRFSLSFTTKSVSEFCSIRWFANCSCKPSAKVHFINLKLEFVSHALRSKLHTNLHFNLCLSSFVQHSLLKLVLNVIQDTHGVVYTQVRQRLSVYNVMPSHF